MKIVRTAFIAGLAAAWVVGALVAQETRITVRVVANDAKIIGTGVGGARVIIRNAATGEVLAAGVQEGGTGDTRAIMVEPRARGVSIFERDRAAHFSAAIQIDTPTVVEVVGEGPLGYEFATQRAVKSVLLVPGQHITGDGIVLNLHGFIVELLEPTVATRGDVSVRTRIRMLCGCTFTPGGLWDADRLTVTARVYAGGELVREAPLRYAGEPNIFEGTIWLADLPNSARLVVLAWDTERVNFGRSQAKPLR